MGMGMGMVWVWYGMGIWYGDMVWGVIVECLTNRRMRVRVILYVGVKVVCSVY